MDSKEDGMFNRTGRSGRRGAGREEPGDAGTSLAGGGSEQTGPTVPKIEGLPALIVTELPSYDPHIIADALWVIFNAPVVAAYFRCRYVGSARLTPACHPLSDRGSRTFGGKSRGFIGVIVTI